MCCLELRGRTTSLAWPSETYQFLRIGQPEVRGRVWMDRTKRGSTIVGSAFHFLTATSVTAFQVNSTKLYSEDSSNRSTSLCAPKLIWSSPLAAGPIP